MTAGEVPPAIDGHRGEVAGRLADAGGLLVGVDFDGTLAPIVDDPDDPEIGRAHRRALARLAARPAATAAVVSGRALGDLIDRVGLDGIVYAGNHGLELRRDGETFVHPAASDRTPAMARVRDRIADRVADVPGCVVEDKGLTLTVHFRRTPDRRREEVRDAVEAGVAQEEDLRIEPGREILEVRPDVDWDKGAAVEFLAAEAPDDWRTVYLGDDATDEDAFRAVGDDGIGVLVGAERETDATYRLESHAAVAPFLDWLADDVLGRIE